MADILDAAQSTTPQLTTDPPATPLPAAPVPQEPEPDLPPGIPSTPATPPVTAPDESLIIPQAPETQVAAEPPTEPPAAEEEKPKKKGFNPAVIITGFLLLFITLPLIFLGVKQQQEVRSKAAGNCTSCSCCGNIGNANDRNQCKADYCSVPKTPTPVPNNTPSGGGGGGGGSTCAAAGAVCNGKSCCNSNYTCVNQGQNSYCVLKSGGTPVPTATPYVANCVQDGKCITQFQTCCSGNKVGASYGECSSALKCGSSSGGTTPNPTTDCQTSSCPGTQTCNLRNDGGGWRCTESTLCKDNKPTCSNSCKPICNSSSPPGSWSCPTSCGSSSIDTNRSTTCNDCYRNRTQAGIDQCLTVNNCNATTPPPSGDPGDGGGGGGGGNGGGGGGNGGGGTGGQCVGQIKILKDGAELSAAELKALKSGDSVTISFKPPIVTTKVRFKVNSDTPIESTTKDGGSFILDWTVPKNVTTFTISAQVFVKGAWRG